MLRRIALFFSLFFFFYFNVGAITAPNKHNGKLMNGARLASVCYKSYSVYIHTPSTIFSVISFTIKFIIFIYSSTTIYKTSKNSIDLMKKLSFILIIKISLQYSLIMIYILFLFLQVCRDVYNQYYEGTVENISEFY